MPFESSTGDLIAVLGRHAGVGLWDALIANGDPFHAASRWTWSPEFRRLLGFSGREDFPDVVESWSSRIHADDVAPTMQVVSAVVADPSPVAQYDMKFRLRTRDHGYRWFRAVGGVVHDASGTATRACGSLIDIHEGTVAEEENRTMAERLVARLSGAHAASQERFAQVAATSPDGILCVSDAGRVTFCNPAFARLVGYAASDLDGRELRSVLAVDVPEHTGFSDAVATLVGRTVEGEALHVDGSRIDVDLSASCWLDDGRTCFGLIVRDIRDRKAKEQALYRMAHLDPLTGIPNRALLRDRLEGAIVEGNPFAVLMVDLDGFKAVNDTHGHEAGDAVLKISAARISACLDARDTLARLGGDEFAVVLRDGSDELRSRTVGERIVAALSEHVDLDVGSVAVSGSVGIAAFPADGREVEALLSRADLALYEAKVGGRNRVRMFDTSLLRSATDKIAARLGMRDAFESGQFEVFYQPQHRLVDGCLTGAEALLRWRHPERGMLLPPEFMPILSRSGLAKDVGAWILDRACRQAATWRRQAPGFRMAVNLFRDGLNDLSLAEDTEAILASSGLAADALELEVTENAMLDLSGAGRKSLRRLLVQGIGIALDDHGTGNAPLSILKGLPITRLKIGRSFVAGMTHSVEDAAVVEAILLLGQRLGLKATAEGVETEGQRRRLLAWHCDDAQGFLFGPAMSASDFEAREFRPPTRAREAA